MNIAIVSAGYPSEGRPFYPFVKNLVDEFAKLGNKCTVVAPQSVTKVLIGKDKSLPVKSSYFAGDTEVTVKRPRVITFSNFRPLDSLATTINSKILTHTLQSIKPKPDVVYCHFWQQAFAAYHYSKTYNIPLFVATGESVIPITKLRKNNKFNEITEYLSGAICVSSKSKDESISNGLIMKGTPILVAPNSINDKIFQKIDRSKCRKELGLNDNDFVVAFTGAFSERKGVLRLDKALKRIADPNIKAIFIGSGDLQPNYINIIFKDRIDNIKIPQLLNAADIFVLPTLNEGCCNAIVEAMACGLPVISSNLPFNLDILDDRNGKLIDPLNISEIADAIKKFKDDDMYRLECSERALMVAEELTISKRAAKILDFIERYK